LETGQLSSLLVGLNAPARGCRDDTIEAVMMTLVDVPLVSPTTWCACSPAWRASRAPIVRRRGDDHGHPVIFDRALFDELRSRSVARRRRSSVRARTRFSMCQ
jgi:CTP:molybdopterin cytidylyltransferase MocA